MFDAINKQFNAAKRNAREEQFILESVMDVEEVLPGSEEDIDDVVDSDSVPDEVYKKVDEMLDKMVDAADYDDTEAEELLDDDDDISDEELDAVITEAIEGNLSEMDEGAQAEAYKARKQAEAKAVKKAEGEGIEAMEAAKSGVRAMDAMDRHERRHGAKNENALEFLRALATGEAKAE